MAERGDSMEVPRLFDLHGSPPTWNAVVRCKQCDSEMVRILNVPEDQRSEVAVRLAFTALECPTGCVSDLNETAQWSATLANLDSGQG